MMRRINSGYKIKDDVDLTVLVNYGFDPSPEFNEYYRYCREDEYMWVNKHNRIIDMTSPDWFCIFTRCKRVLNKLIKDGLAEETDHLGE